VTENMEGLKIKDSTGDVICWWLCARWFGGGEKIMKVLIEVFLRYSSY